MPHILSVQVGRVAPLGPDKVPSGFVKSPLGGQGEITLAGLAGDEQADLTVHGDAAKAVYAYAEASYAIWRESHPRHAALWQAPGALAENLTVTGLVEEDVCIGDVVRVGTAMLQVTQPREPCFKFALRFQDPTLPRAMIRNGRSGWYYRVLEAGRVAAGSPVTLERRLNPDWTIPRMNAFIHAKHRSPEQARELASVSGLAETWIPRLAKLAA